MIARAMGIVGCIKRLPHWIKVFFCDAHKRRGWLFRTFVGGGFQPYNVTKADRYPAIFRAARALLGDGTQLRILSFGCASGEEAFSLRAYFPAAGIKGIDVNPLDIAEARRRAKRSGDGRLEFAVANSTVGEPGASYDAIFCMAVLRHGHLGKPGVVRCDPLLYFADFEKTVADFARCLKPGGLLAIRHANFRFCDAFCAADFDVALRVPARTATPLFGRDNRLLEGASYDEALFRKRPVSACGS